MLTADEKIALIRQKIERAKKHIADLKIARDAFLDTKPYGFVTEYNSDTGQQEFRAAHDFSAAPDDIGLIAGDAIHNLRSALDHLACQLVLTNGQPILTQTAFPIFDSATKYQTMRTGKVKGMSQDAIDAIDAAEPYQNGKGDALWVVHQLDIADKHKTLLIADVRVNDFRLKPAQSIFDDRDFFQTLSFNAPGFGARAKAGDLLFTVNPKVYKDVNLGCDIAFSEPNVIQGHTVLVSLQQLTYTVDHLILSFKPLLV